MKVGCFLVLFIISFLFSNDDAAQPAPLSRGQRLIENVGLAERHAIVKPRAALDQSGSVLGGNGFRIHRTGRRTNVEASRESIPKVRALVGSGVASRNHLQMNRLIS